MSPWLNTKDTKDPQRPIWLLNTPPPFFPSIVKTNPISKKLSSDILINTTQYFRY